MIILFGIMYFIKLRNENSKNRITKYTNEFNKLDGAAVFEIFTNNDEIIYKLKTSTQPQGLNVNKFKGGENKNKIDFNEELKELENESKNKISNEIINISDKIQNQINDSINDFNEVPGISNFKNLQTVMINDNIYTLTAEQFNKLKSFKPNIDNIKNEVESNIENIKNSIENNVENVENNVKSNIENVKNQVKSIKDILKNDYITIQTDATKYISDIVTKFSTTITEISKYISSMVSVPINLLVKWLINPNTIISLSITMIKSTVKNIANVLNLFTFKLKKFATNYALSKFDVFIEALKTFYSSVIYNPIVGKIKNAFLYVINRLYSCSQFTQQVLSFITPYTDGLYNIITEIFNSIHPNNLKSLLNDVILSLFEEDKDKNLKTSILSKFKNIVQIFKNYISHISQSITDFANLFKSTFDNILNIINGKNIPSFNISIDNFNLLEIINSVPEINILKDEMVEFINVDVIYNQQPLKLTYNQNMNYKI